MANLAIVDILPFFVVSLFWGVTNPFIEMFSRK
jgi:hypothetical protein